ncbi:hypothetical protein BN1723_012530 [Verticillium longisporum]|uniref:Uncharacterized protein n=1 Tax=Verticillium longisporum TaxID=100787 RepID=A0A0G4LIZ6_VERLO|nr:hypothetical protein BN1723_012530 [Verticillium longisporum]
MTVPMATDTMRRSRVRSTPSTKHSKSRSPNGMISGLPSSSFSYSLASLLFLALPSAATRNLDLAVASTITAAVSASTATPSSFSPLFWPSPSSSAMPTFG